MKIGIYGGTFNPPHLGHVTAGRMASEILGLDRLYFVPTGTPPHKSLPEGSPTGEQRLEMTRLALAQTGLEDRAQVLDIEVSRPGRSYTEDTVAEIAALHPGDTLWLLMGTDMFLTFQRWKDPERILSMAGIAAFGRTEADTEELFTPQRIWLHRKWPQARIFTMTLPGVVDVSSTQVRQQLSRGGGGRYLPPAVYGYLLRKGLYGTKADLKHLPFSQLRPVALSHLHPRRMPHVLGTEQEAICLAVRYGGDVEKARRAALLHDCTKRLSPEEHFQICEQYGIELGIERQNHKLLHAVTGAAVAREVYGADREMEDAIRYHTTGRAHMGLLEKILYLADYIEPSRDFPGVDKLRAACYEDLDEGLRLGLAMSVQELTARGEAVHGATLEALEAVRKKR